MGAVHRAGVAAALMFLIAPAGRAQSEAPAPAAAPHEVAPTGSTGAEVAPAPKTKVVYKDANPHLNGAQWVQNTWDLNLDLLVGGIFRDDNPFAFAVRLRHGALFVREPWFMSIGPTVQIGMEHPAAFGVQAELMHLAAGFWGHAGLHVDVQGRFGGQLSGGYTWVGAELQLRQGRKPGEADFALYGVVRVPLRFFIFASQDY